MLISFNCKFMRLRKCGVNYELWFSKCSPFISTSTSRKILCHTIHNRELKNIRMTGNSIQLGNNSKMLFSHFVFLFLLGIGSVDDNRTRECVDWFCCGK